MRFVGRFLGLLLLQACIQASNSQPGPPSPGLKWCPGGPGRWQSCSISDQCSVTPQGVPFCGRLGASCVGTGGNTNRSIVCKVGDVCRHDPVGVPFCAGPLARIECRGNNSASNVTVTCESYQSCYHTQVGVPYCAGGTVTGSPNQGAVGNSGASHGRPAGEPVPNPDWVEIVHAPAGSMNEPTGDIDVGTAWNSMGFGHFVEMESRSVYKQPQTLGATSYDEMHILHFYNCTGQTAETTAIWLTLHGVEVSREIPPSRIVSPKPSSNLGLSMKYICHKLYPAQF